MLSGNVGNFTSICVASVNCLVMMSARKSYSMTEPCVNLTLCHTTTLKEKNTPNNFSSWVMLTALCFWSSLGMDQNLYNVYLEKMGESNAFSISVKGRVLYFFFLSSPGEGHVICNWWNVYISQCFRMSCLLGYIYRCVPDAAPQPWFSAGGAISSASIGYLVWSQSKDP